MHDIEINFYDRWNVSDLQEATEIAVDLETTALKPWDGHIRLCQVYLPHLDEVAVIDLFKPQEEQLIWFSYFLEVLENPEVIKYYHNALFDGLWLLWKTKRLSRNNIDSMILSQIKNAGTYHAYLKNLGVPNPNSLGEVAKEFKIKLPKELQSSNWSELNLTQSQIEYAAKDPIATYLVGSELYAILSKTQSEVVKAELGCIEAFLALSYTGMPCDISTLNSLLRNYSEAEQTQKSKLSRLMPYDPAYHEKVVKHNAIVDEEIREKGKTRKKYKNDRPFNVNSSSQIKDYLLSKGYERFMTTKEGKISTGKEILFYLASEFPDDKSLKDITLYRGVSKAASTLKSYRESYDSKRKMIYTSYSTLASQGMGRSSSGEKQSLAQNCQNVSKWLPSHEAAGLKPIRSFMKPRKGYVLAEFDLDASHAQFARHLSKDRNLNRAKNEGIKLHYFTLSEMLAMEGKRYTPEECILLCSGKLDSGNHSYYKRLYKLSKNVFYSFLNYSGAARLQSTFFSGEVFVKLEECKKYLDACARAFSDLRYFQDTTYANAMKTKHRRSTLDGRDLGVFIVSNPCDGARVYHEGKPYFKANSDEYFAKGSYIDRIEYRWKISDIVSTEWLRPEATVTKNTLKQVQDFQLTNDYDFRLVNFSHDSFMVECLQRDIDNVLPYCWEALKDNMQKYIPDYEPEDSWQECIKKESWEK